MRTVKSLCLAVVVMALLLSFGAMASAKEKVIFDTDMAQLFDDGVAMIMLAQSPYVDLLGVTNNYGNNWVPTGVAYALRQLELIGHPEIGVYPGCQYPLRADRVTKAVHDYEVKLLGAGIRKNYDEPADYLSLPADRVPYGGFPVTEPQAENGVDFIIDTVRANPGEVTLVAVGGMTNVACAITQAPDIVPLVKRIVYMCAAFDIPGNTTPAAEFNIYQDPEAAKIVFRAPWNEQVFNSLDIDQWYLFKKSIYDRIVAVDTPVTRMFKALYGARFESNPNWTRLVWDTLSAAYVIDPTIFTEIQERYVDCDSNYGPDYGRTLSYREGRQPAGLQKAKILWKLDEKRFFDLMVSLMTLPISNPVNAPQ